MSTKSKINFDTTTSAAINAFVSDVDKLLPDIYNELAYIPYTLNDSNILFYGNKICDIIDKHFKFYVDFIEFYTKWLSLDISLLNNVRIDNYPDWHKFIRNYRKINGGKEIIELIIREMESPF